MKYRTHKTGRPPTERTGHDRFDIRHDRQWLGWVTGLQSVEKGGDKENKDNKNTAFLLSHTKLNTGWVVIILKADV